MNRSLPHLFSLAIMLAALWLLLSGHYEPLMLSFGAVSVILSVWLAHRMPVVDRQSHPLHMLIDMPIFWIRLFAKVIVSNLDVAARILGLKKIDPQLIELDCRHYTDLQKVIYANAITLTPGSASLHLEDGKLWVHCISKEGADELLKGDMQKLIPEDDAEDQAAS